MKKPEFKKWLTNVYKGGVEESAGIARVSNAQRVEDALGDLDVHFDKDQLEYVLNQLKYAKGEDKPLPHGIEISGDKYDGMSSLRQGVRRYREFREYTGLLECKDENIQVKEIVMPQHLKEVKDWKMENMESNSNELLLVPIKDLAQHTFIIEGYQRGYKWGKKEILELLNDIDSYDHTQGLYCLQPLILKPISKEQVEDTNSTSIVNEVIDGQQRTTTLFLILKYLVHKRWIDKSVLYTLDFKTRQRSGEFLNTSLELIYNLSLEGIKSEEFTALDYTDLNAVNALWVSFITANKKFDNVDVYHFFTVSCYLIRWMQVHLEDETTRQKFIDKLLQHVKVIWYALKSTQGSDEIIKVFLNNNKGKISLTSSELIKALFVLDIKNREPEAIAELKINQFTTEWDLVEKQLHDERFWYFIQPNEAIYNQGTRIDFLFDLKFEKPNESDSFFAYRKIETLFNTNQEISIYWEEVMRLHYKLINWFEDKELYHFIGFLVNSGIRSLKKLLEESNGKSRELYKVRLKDIVKEEFHKTVKREQLDVQPYLLESLHYRDFYKQTLNVLLLHNVFYYLENMANYKFPFDLYVKQNWSIEHINPQNPKDFGDKVVLIQWLIDMHAYANKELNERLISELEKLSIDEINKNRELLKTIDDFAREIEDITHSIDNLLLLDKNTNSALGNKSFKDKRAKIIEFDKQGYNDEENKKPVFIPIETLNAFNKTASKEINIENWTKEDGNRYSESIADRLIDYLPKKN